MEESSPAFRRNIQASALLVQGSRNLHTLKGRQTNSESAECDEKDVYSGHKKEKQRIRSE